MTRAVTEFTTELGGDESRRTTMPQLKEQRGDSLELLQLIRSAGASNRSTNSSHGMTWGAGQQDDQSSWQERLFAGGGATTRYALTRATGGDCPFGL